MYQSIWLLSPYGKSYGKSYGKPYAKWHPALSYGFDRAGTSGSANEFDECSMQRDSRQRRHPSATLDWERLSRTDVAIYPKTDHNNRQAAHRPGRAPLKPLTLDAAGSSFMPRFPQ